MNQNLQHDVMRLGGDIVESERFAKAKDVVHHSKERSIQLHSYRTAMVALAFAKWLGRCGVAINEADVVRASLLHDIGMTVDEVSASPSYRKAFSHPREGTRIAREEFGANGTQADAIAHHMWPIGLVPPRTREGWVVLAADKACSVSEAAGIARATAVRAVGTLASKARRIR